MTLSRHILNFFFSLKTTLWLLGLLLVLMVAGALVMPGKQEFQALHSLPLFTWLLKEPLAITWWLWGLIAVLVVVAINTVLCSIESVVKKRNVTQWLLLISPQIIHAGFLFVLLAHLLSALGSSQELAAVQKGSLLNISRDWVLKIQDIEIRLDYYGYVTDWKVEVEYLSNGTPLLQDTISPNNPSDEMGFNINVKDLRLHPVEAVLLQINREPGAFWALIGGVLSMVGIITLILLKMKMER